jgi:hypothetical protein
MPNKYYQKTTTDVLQKCRRWPSNGPAVNRAEEATSAVFARRGLDEKWISGPLLWPLLGTMKQAQQLDALSHTSITCRSFQRA